jgi:polyhydroxybutyrate depolymerase
MSAHGRTRGHRRMLPVVFALLAVPVVLAAGEAMRYHAANRESGSITSGGVERTYLLHVPANHDVTTPAPLVISLHGGGIWPAAQRDLSRWNDVADEHGFIVVYPSGLGKRTKRAWRTRPGPGIVADVRFITELIDTLAARYRIDTSRVYADGISNGAGMALLLSCALADRIAAVGLVAAAHLTPWEWCAGAPPVPVMMFHGTADALAPYHGGPAWLTPRVLPAVSTVAALWAERNRCGRIPRDSTVAPTVTRRAWHDCNGKADVVLYTIDGGGHTWPSGGTIPAWIAGRTSHEIDASRVLWEFYRGRRVRR